jgi:hypothetical protein
VIIDELQDNITRKGDMRENIKGKGTVIRERNASPGPTVPSPAIRGERDLRRVARGRNELGAPYGSEV